MFGKFVVAAGILHGAAAYSQEAPPEKPVSSDMIVGVWQCSLQADGVKQNGAVTYRADGTSEFHLTITMDTEGNDVRAQVVGESTWQLLPDAMLKQDIVKVEAREGAVYGKPLPAGALKQLTDRLASAPSSRSRVTATSTTLVLSGGTSCTRPAK